MYGFPPKNMVRVLHLTDVETEAQRDRNLAKVIQGGVLDQNYLHLLSNSTHTCFPD